jgi:CBS domain-containing protein
MKIRDVMTVDVVTVTPETSLHEVARLLSERRISGLPVIDVDGRCIGVVSEADVLVKELGHPGPRRPLEWILGDRHDADELRRRAARTAREAMSAPPITIEPDRPVRIAADLMVGQRVNRLPVVEGGRLVGIVTRADLVRAYLRLDDEIVRTIREEILQHTMWLDPAAFHVEAQEGLVRIEGAVDRRSTARILEKLIGLVDGVAGVESRLTWRFDDLDVQPAADGDPEPGAASVTARERPPAMHR